MEKEPFDPLLYPVYWDSYPVLSIFGEVRSGHKLRSFWFLLSKEPWEVLQNVGFLDGI
jgi:hypothetical protein